MVYMKIPFQRSQKTGQEEWIIPAQSKAETKAKELPETVPLAIPGPHL